MVDTIKFSEFANGGNLENADTTVGLAGGANAYFNNPWTFMASGTTAERPAVPDPTVNYRLRFNTSLLQYEFYNASAVAWQQLDNGGDVTALIARLAAYTAGNGASMIGLQNQTGVASKTVQDLANATIIAKTYNGTLTNAQYLADLTTGILKSTTTTGVLSISAPLTSIDGLTTAANKMIYTTASNVYAVTDLTSFARTLLDDANAADAAATLAVLALAGGTMTGNINFGGFKGTNAAEPTASTDYATKNYVDNAVQNVHAPCIAATTADLAGYTYDNGTAGVGATLTAGGFGAFSTDGVSPAQDARILVWVQSAGAQNGVYTLTTVGDGGTAAVLTRATDYDTASDMQAGDEFTVLQGTLYGVSEFVMTQTAAITVGTTAITFAERSVSGALLAANNLSDVDSDVTSRQNLGVEIGVDVQAHDAGLDDIAGLAVTDGNIIVGDGANWVAESGSTARASLGAQETLSGLSLTAVTVATDDKVLIQDTSDSNNLKTVTAQSIADLAGAASTATNLFNTTAVTVTDTTGRVTYPAQPAFYAYQNAGVSNATGDGTVYTVICDTAIKNIGSYLNTTTGIFTAPVTGLYVFTFYITLNNIGAAHTTAQVQLATTATAGTIKLLYANPYAMLGLADGVNIFGGTAVVQLSATETVTPQIIVSGSTKTVSSGGLTNKYNFFSGWLLG